MCSISSPLPAIRASTPHSPSQPSPYERRSGSGPYAHPSTYPSPAKTEADPSNYMTASMAFYSYSTMPLQNQALLPLSPHPSDNWTLSLASSMSPSMIDGRGWSESYESVGRSPMPSWEQQFQYAPSDSFGETVHSPAHSDSHIISQRSSVSSTYDHSLYSQDSSDSTFIKAEPYSDWKSDEDSTMGQQPLTVSPLRLRQTCSVPQSENPKVSTCTERTRSRSKTTPANANFKCEVCSRLFQRAYNHKSHMHTHDPKREKPNVCQVKRCERKFVRKTDLQRHEESVHVKSRNFQCTACGANFSRKDTLRRHTEDGCPRRFEVMTRQAQTEGSGRRQSALPIRHHGLPPQQQVAPQHMQLG